MKKISVFYALFLLLAGTQVHSQAKKSNEFIIHVNVKGDNIEGKKVYLAPDGVFKMLDSTVIKNGAFEFKGSVAYPQLYIMLVEKSSAKQRFRPIIPLFVENTNISVLAVLDSMTTELQYLYMGSGYSYHNIKVTGSASHNLFMKYMDGFEPLNKLSSKAFDDYITYLNPPKGKEKGPISEGIALVDHIDAMRADALAYVREFIKNNSNSPVALYAASNKIGSFTVKELDEMVASLSPALKATVGGKNLLTKAAAVRKTATGAQFVDFAFNDKDGNPVKLSDYVGKGKYVLMDFWASWCGPCRADIPHLKEAYELYHPAGFEVISVSMDDNKDKWLKAIDEEQMKWLQVSDLKAFSGDFSKIYNFNGIPTCVLVGPDGKIITRNMRALWMDRKLIGLYGNKFGDKY